MNFKFKTKIENAAVKDKSEIKKFKCQILININAPI
jgi:hypothetical protein